MGFFQTPDIIPPNLLAMDVKIEESWKRVLDSEFQKPEFEKLAGFIRSEYSGGSYRIYPPAGDIFRAFDLTPFSDVKVVIIGQDPYHGPGQANGLCFSVNSGVPLPPSLQNIFREIEVESGKPAPADGDLSRWARQGVLLLNSSLTVREHAPKSHSGIGWESLTDAAVRALAERRDGIVFMLWGSDAIRKGAFIDRGKHLVLTSPHPSPLSAYRGFFGNGHFTEANRYLVSKNKKPIEW